MFLAVSILSCRVIQMSKHQYDQKLRCQHSSLCYAPWHYITVAGRQWIVKSAFSEHHYEILFSNFTNVWHELLQSCDVEQRSKEINPSLEIDLSKLLIHIQCCIMECNSDSRYDMQLSSDLQLIFTVTSKLSGLPFCWKFFAASVSLDMIRHHLTEPLMAMVADLNRQKQELITLLKNKDREITDLKAQGINVSRKKLETAVFDEASFNQNALKSKNSKSCIQDATMSSFTVDSQLLYTEIMKVGEFCSAQTSSERVVQDSSAEGSSHNAPSTAALSANSSPAKSPHKLKSSQSQEIEMERRLALEKQLADQEKKDSLKKRKKIKF